MAQIELTSDARQSLPRIHLDWIFSTLIKPKTTFEKILSLENGVWFLPLTILTVSAMLLVVVTAHASIQAGLGVNQALPPNFEYFAPQSQDQFQQAMEVVNGPIFRYLLPAIIATARVWLGWLIVASGLHFILTLMGGRGSNRSVMNMTAWAGLPFALRDLLRIAYVVIEQQSIKYPGLSGFAPSNQVSLLTSGYTELLSLIDIYWLWHVILLLVVVKTYRDLPLRKGVVAVLIIQIVALLIQIVPGLLSQHLADLSIVQPFFF
jgi:hypothetical protein